MMKLFKVQDFKHHMTNYKVVCSVQSCGSS